MPEKYSTYYNSPAGILKVSENNSFITELLFIDEAVAAVENTGDLPPVLTQCIRELEAYFNGEMRKFEVPVQQTGTVFQQRVWNELMSIPFGKTISYVELAKRLGDVKAIRAAASTNGKNKVGIIVPCHRVIGANQDLVGYAGGLPRKRFLLAHESKFASGVQTLF